VFHWGVQVCTKTDTLFNQCPEEDKVRVRPPPHATLFTSLPKLKPDSLMSVFLFCVPSGVAAGG
jgi:hypothetical protein